MTHERVHELRQGPRFAKSDECVPMVGHNHKRAEVDALMLHRECKRLDYYLAQVWREHRFFWSE